MSHEAQTNEIWHIHEWVMSCTYKHTETHMNTRKDTYEVPAGESVVTDVGITHE